MGYGTGSSSYVKNFNTLFKGMCHNCKCHKSLFFQVLCLIRYLKEPHDKLSLDFFQAGSITWLIQISLIIFNELNVFFTKLILKCF